MDAACYRTLSTLLATAIVLASCSRHDAGSAQQAPPNAVNAVMPSVADTANPFRSTGHRYGAPTGKIRVANLLEIGGHQAGPLDFYDVRDPDSLTVPVIKHLGYGELSSYISPRAADPGARSNLYVFPAGTRSATLPFGTNMDNTGFDSTEQATIALGPTKTLEGQSMSEITIVEAGKPMNRMLADSETALASAKGLLVLRTANINADSIPEQYLAIDGACPQTRNDGRSGGVAVHRVSSEELFPIAAGTHTVGVVTSPRGRVLESCAGHTPTATMSITIAAGQRDVVWIYGLPSDGITLLVSPMAGP